MWSNTLAELHKLARRPAYRLLLAVAVVIGAVFTYLIPYAAYRTGDATMPGGDRGLAAVLPDQLVGNAIAGLPVFVGAIALVIGALAVGSEYDWGTWKTVLTQGPSRLSVLLGKLVAVTVAAGVLTAAMFGSGAIQTAVIALGEGRPLEWPGIGEILIGFAGGWLVATMWATLGILLAVLLRGVALPIGLGLVWMLAVQNLLSGLAAPMLDAVADLQTGLPGPNAGSLVAALGAPLTTPGVEELVGGTQSALVVAGYLVVFAAFAGWSLRRRDID